MNTSLLRLGEPFPRGPPMLTNAIANGQRQGSRVVVARPVVIVVTKGVVKVTTDFVRQRTESTIGILVECTVCAWCRNWVSGHFAVWVFDRCAWLIQNDNPSPNGDD